MTRRQTRRRTVRCTPPDSATPTSGGEPSISPIGSLFAMPFFPWGSTLRWRGWPQRRGKVKLQRGGEAEFESWADPLPHTATPAARQGKFGGPLPSGTLYFLLFLGQATAGTPGQTVCTKRCSAHERRCNNHIFRQDHPQMPFIGHAATASANESANPPSPNKRQHTTTPKRLPASKQINKQSKRHTGTSK